MNWRVAFDALPKPPEPPPSEAAAVPIVPRVEDAEPEPPKINADDPEYWSRPASPAEIAVAEAYRDALERRDEREERRLRTQT